METSLSPFFLLEKKILLKKYFFFVSFPVAPGADATQNG